MKLKLSDRTHPIEISYREIKGFRRPTVYQEYNSFVALPTGEYFCDNTVEEIHQMIEDEKFNEQFEEKIK